MATIAVVGGGLAGLTCGLRLQQAGHAVRVLERAPEVGGRARSVQRGDFVLDTGAPVVTTGQRYVVSLARELGVLASLRAWSAGRDLRLPLVQGAERARRSRLGVVRGLGALRSRETLRAALDLRRAERVFDPATDASAATARRGATADALCWWPDPPDDDDPLLGGVPASLRGLLPHTAPHGFLDGIGTLARALARSLDVVTDCDVTRVESDSHGVTLEVRAAGRERRVRADASVLALPATRVSALCPKLTPDERGFFEAARSRPGVIVHLLFERAPRLRRFRSVRFQGAEGDGELELRSLCAEHERPGAAPEGAALLRAALTPQAAARMHRASDASIADLVLENLAYSPVGALRPDGYAVSRHADAVPEFGLAHCRRLARFVSRLERSPRLVFAGDFLAGPSLDAAVASGHRAASEIAQLGLSVG